MLFVVPRYHTNQVGWVRALRDLGCKVDMLVHVVGPTEDHAQLVPVRLPESVVGRLLNLLSKGTEANRPYYVPTVSSLVAFIRAHRPNVVVIRPYGPLYWLLAAVLARLMGASVIWYRQRIEFAYRGRSGLGGWALRATFNALLRCLSSRTITPIWDPGAPDSMRTRHWCLVPFIAPVRREAHRTDPTYGTVNVLTVGKFMQRKRIDLLLHALAWCARTSDCKVRLTIAGEVSTPAHRDILTEVRQLIDRLGLEKITSIQLNVDPAAMTDLYQSTHLFVLPAQNEPASVSVVEALSHGVPAVCSSTCGTRCYIRHGVTGAIFESGNRDALEAVLHPLLTNPHRLEEMAMAAADDAQTRFGVATFMAGFNRALKGTGFHLAVDRGGHCDPQMRPMPDPC